MLKQSFFKNCCLYMLYNHISNLFNLTCLFLTYFNFITTESKVIKSAKSSTTVIAPNFSSTRRKRNVPNNRKATYTLESSSNADVVVTIPEEAFQGNLDARLVALLKSDTTMLPQQPANVPGDFSGKLQTMLLDFNKSHEAV